MEVVRESTLADFGEKALCLMAAFINNGALGHAIEYDDALLRMYTFIMLLHLPSPPLSSRREDRRSEWRGLY